MPLNTSPATLALLNDYQHGFPLCVEPFATIAQQTGLRADAVLAQYMSLVSAALILVFPLASMAADWRRERRVHAEGDARGAARVDPPEQEVEALGDGRYALTLTFSADSALQR